MNIKERNQVPFQRVSTIALEFKMSTCLVLQIIIVLGLQHIDASPIQDQHKATEDAVFPEIEKLDAGQTCPVYLGYQAWDDFVENLHNPDAKWEDVKGKIVGKYAQSKKEFGTSDLWTEWRRDLFTIIFQELDDDQIREICDCLYK